MTEQAGALKETVTDQQLHATFSDNETLRTAVRLWCTDEPTARLRYGDLSRWDTSKVTNMSGLFCNARAFNGDLSRWDTSEVTDMSCMFSNATAFNGDLSRWDTSKVINMTYMFCDATAFNGDLSRWDTSKVTDMSCMFASAAAFNGDLSRWDTSKVTDTHDMFADTFEWRLSDAWIAHFPEWRRKRANVLWRRYALPFAALKLWTGKLSFGLRCWRVRAHARAYAPGGSGYAALMQGSTARTMNVPYEAKRQRTVA
jgi:surface protein